MSSIRRQLLIWLLVGLSVSTVVAAFAVYKRTWAEAGELFDYQLQLMSVAFPHEGFGSATAPPLDAADAGDVMVVQIWNQNGARVYLSRPGAAVPQSVNVGFSTVRGPNGDWRVYNTLVGNNIVQVAQPMRVREELAAGLALRTMAPLLILLPILILLIWVTVGRGLRPLNEVASAVGKRSAEVLEPLPSQHLPSEVKPLVTALNDLLARLENSLNLQRTFIADAAHELRTPLTAVRLQVQMAERAGTDGERAAAFAHLKGGIDRATRLVEQLLTLARNEPDAAERPFLPVDLLDVAREIVAERAPVADAKGVDLGLSGETPARIMGDAGGLRAMLGNVVDNAIHYTPAGGKVDVEVAVKDGRATVVVRDTGPGIPVAERERIFDRFYRGRTAGVTGSGLGLAIVRKVAQRHRATIDLGTDGGGCGLKIAVRFPPAECNGQDR